MIKLFKPLFNICAFLTLVFISCKKESDFNTKNNNNQFQNELKSMINQVKIWHDSTVSSNLKSKTQNGLTVFSVNDNDIIPPFIDWDNAFINYDSNDVKSITVPISINYKNGEHMELVATKSRNKINGYFIKVTPDSACFANQIDLYNYTNFSGSVSIYNLIGVRLKIQNFKTGIVIKSDITKNSLDTKTTYEIAPPCEECTLNTVIVTGSRIINYYTGYNYTLSYIHIGYNQNLELDEFGGGGGVIAGGGAPDGIVDDINTNITDPCISSVLSAILSKDKQIEMMSYVNKQFGLNEKCNLNIKDVQNLTNTRGEPVAGLAKVIRHKDVLTIEISINYGRGSSKEFIAATILHEMIHGYIVSQNIQQNGKEDVLADSKYIGWMSTALISLFPNLSPTDANALALGGLQYTSYFNNLSIDTQNDCNKINAMHEIGEAGQKCN